jgi:hypothetical protein
MRNRGQVTIFIIIAIIIIGAVAVFFSIRGGLFVSEIPASIEPVYTSFLSCLEDDTLTGVDILESQAGYIELPDFEPGSAYMPFSSQLNFLGNPVPYWYYVSGNNIQKEQVPTKTDMENQIALFVEAEIRGCRFGDYNEQGFEVSLGEPKASIDIQDSKIEVDLKMDFGVNKENDSAFVTSHKITVNSELGNLYDAARKVYEEEQKNLFLEEYAVDTLRLYAPVDGVEITCSPLIWNAEEVFDELQEAIEVNTLALTTESRGDDYFIVDLPVDEEVRFINSKNWPNSFEVLPSEEVLLMANPVGNQQGLGALGFCYVPYHFVYNVRYPVLVQVFEGEEIFQFPMAIVLQGNNPREALDVLAVETAVPELCKFKNTNIQVNAYDTGLNPVEADISYECFSNKCNIGKTQAGQLSENFPQCVNGYVVASADGFVDARYLFSTVTPGSLDVIMEKLYDTNVELMLDSAAYNDDAIITFVSDGSSKTIIYPEQRTVELSEGQYEVQVYIYEDSEVTIGSTVKEQCVDVPRGVLGVFGFTKERCFDIEIPEQIISNALAGGGKQNHYILESELSSRRTLTIDAESLPSPDTIEQLQDNHYSFETKSLDIFFK